MENVYVRVLLSYSQVVEDERVSIANEWVFFYTYQGEDESRSKRF